MKFFLFTGILFSGLVAGLLYAYSCSVNAGLRLLSDSGYLKAMQSINIAIQNPLFFISFMGLLFIFPVTSYLLFKAQNSAFLLFAAAMVIYFTGVFGVTLFCNVPLNEKLARFSIATAGTAEIAAMRKIFEKPWNFYHTVRTVASVISFALTILAALKTKF